MSLSRNYGPRDFIGKLLRPNLGYSRQNDLLGNPNSYREYKPGSPILLVEIRPQITYTHLSVGLLIGVEMEYLYYHIDDFYNQWSVFTDF